MRNVILPILTIRLYGKLMELADIYMYILTRGRYIRYTAALEEKVLCMYVAAVENKNSTFTIMTIDSHVLALPLHISTRHCTRFARSRPLFETPPRFYIVIPSPNILYKPSKKPCFSIDNVLYRHIQT